MKKQTSTNTWLSISNTSLRLWNSCDRNSRDSRTLTFRRGGSRWEHLESVSDDPLETLSIGDRLQAVVSTKLFLQCDCGGNCAALGSLTRLQAMVQVEKRWSLKQTPIIQQFRQANELQAVISCQLLIAIFCLKEYSDINTSRIPWQGEINRSLGNIYSDHHCRYFRDFYIFQHTAVCSMTVENSYVNCIFRFPLQNTNGPFGILS